MPAHGNRQQFAERSYARRNGWTLPAPRGGGGRIRTGVRQFDAGFRGQHDDTRRATPLEMRTLTCTPAGQKKQPHVFRLHRSRVYYVRESLLRQAISVPRANLISLGVCLGKFSKTEKFRLHVTALDLMGKYAKNKVRAPSPRHRVARGRA